ncbi:hypothetical protein PG985_000259 [Apiospora marii]|uniref:uncharacterized protein n=1 Tax=Apiospora marii TaxID=335849 RepID=UPI00312E3ABD
MDPNTATHSAKATGRNLAPISSQQDAAMRNLYLLAIYCQLHTILHCLHENESSPEDTDPAVTRTIATILTTLGQALDDIEACAEIYAWEADTEEEEYVSFVMSFYYDVREVFDDYLV